MIKDGNKVFCIFLALWVAALILLFIYPRISQGIVEKPQWFIPIGWMILLPAWVGAVGIRYGRHAVVCGLIADFAGIFAAILSTYYFFG